MADSSHCSLLLLDDFSVSLSDEGKLDTVTLGELDQGLLALTDDEAVGETSSEGGAVGVLDVDDLVGTGVVLDVHEGSDTTDIVTGSEVAGGSVFEFNNTVDLASLKVKLLASQNTSIKYNSFQEKKKEGARATLSRGTYLDRVVLLDVGVGEADRSAVVGHNIRNFVFAKHLSLDLAQLEASLLGVNADGLEATLVVVQNAEVFASLGERDDVHHAEREPVVAADLVVNFDIARLVFADFDRLLAGEGVVKSVAEQDTHGDALSELVGASGRARRRHTTEFVQAPVGGSPHSLHMLLWSSCLRRRSKRLEHARDRRRTRGRTNATTSHQHREEHLPF